MSKQKAKTAAEVIKARRIALNTKQEYISLLSRVVVLILAVYVVFTQIFIVTRNTGISMSPAIKDGDLVLAFRLQKDYVKNDVVVYRADGKNMIGRVVACDNDAIVLDDSGVMLVNNAVQNGEIMYPTYAKEKTQYPYMVPEKSVFIMGDYRIQSVDSRDFGAVSKDDVIGKVITILRRRGL